MEDKITKNDALYGISELEFANKKHELMAQRIERIFNKAEKNGYRFPFSWILIKKMDLLFGEWRWIDSIFFDAEFAMAFFGEKKVTKGKWVVCYEFQQHLREMAIIPIEERIYYLEKFL